MQLSLSAKNLRVSWSPPPTWGNMDILPLKYHIMYQWTSRGIHKSVTVSSFNHTHTSFRGTPSKVFLKSPIVGICFFLHLKLLIRFFCLPRDPRTHIHLNLIHVLLQLGPFESTSVNLRELTPGRSYLFQVCAKELLGLGRCSNWSSAVNITLPRNNL